MNTGKNYTFWEFLKENRIVIPIIQRDYAQGREGKKELRKRFLKSIKDAIEDDKKSLTLDFVYGMQKGTDGIIPLDGQQRLTTLWLLHWYAFLRSNKNITINNLPLFRNFSYETRLSSRLFIENLCDGANFRKLRNSSHDGENDEPLPIYQLITQQTWFLKEWEQDPTVKAMLNMLGGKAHSIETEFNGMAWVDIWDKLQNGCPINFYYLPIDGEIQQDPDDIYIKVNARGEQLTDFENFKADLIKYVKDDKQQQWQIIFKIEHPDLALSKLIDTDWTDVFWNDLPEECKKIDKNPPEGKEPKLPNIDRQFFAFLNRYFVNCILLDNSIKADDLQPKNRMKSDNKKVILFNSLYEEKGVPFKYKDFAIFKEADVITPENFMAIKNIMINLKNVEINDWGIKWPQEKEEGFCFLPKFNDNRGTITDDISQKHRIVFFGICCYLQTCNDNKVFCQEEYQAWMRYVWNIAYNSNVQDIDSMKNVMMLIINSFNGMKNCGYDIINYLSHQKITDGTGYFERQKFEEWEKASYYNNKKDAIINAENTFHGSIRFILPSVGNQQSQDLLDSKYIEKAKKLLDSDQWIKEILPYLSNAFNEPNSNYKKKEIIFTNDENDNIKVVNYCDDLVDAVQRKLKDEKCDVGENSWIYPLLNIPGLIDYSTSKKIQNYYYWEKADEKKGIYLFKRSNWSPDSCILLYSFNAETQKKVVARNQFIIDSINNEGFRVYNDSVDQEAEDEVKYSDNPHFGRAIILKNDNDNKVYYCGVNGYYDVKLNQITDYQQTLI